MQSSVVFHVWLYVNHGEGEESFLFPSLVFPFNDVQFYLGFEVFITNIRHIEYSFIITLLEFLKYYSTIPMNIKLLMYKHSMRNFLFSWNFTKCVCSYGHFWEPIYKNKPQSIIQNLLGLFKFIGSLFNCLVLCS